MLSANVALSFSVQPGGHAYLEKRKEGVARRGLQTSARCAAVPCMSLVPAATSASMVLQCAPWPATQTDVWMGTGSQTAGVAVMSAVGAYRGRLKPHNQDAFVVETVRPTPGAAEALLIGVFDGHGTRGEAAALHISRVAAEAVHACAARAVAAASGDGSSSSDVSSSGSSGSSLPAAAAAWAEPANGYSSDSTPNSVVNLAHPTALSADATAAAALPGALAFTLDSARNCLEQVFKHVADSVAAAYDVGAAASAMADSGSTAVMCLVLQDSVVAAWAGDSRAVVGTAEEGGAYSATQLTEDHTPHVTSEANRISDAGGWVVKVGASDTATLRVVLPPEQLIPGLQVPSLSVTRAFGDLHLASAGVIATPDFATFPLLPRSPAGTAHGSQARPAHVLVVASDGLWEVVSNEEAVGIAGSAGSPGAAAQRLLTAAQQRWAARHRIWHCDDITVCVAYL